MIVFGVTLTSNLRRLSSIVCLEGGETPKLVWCNTFTEDQDLLSMVERWYPKVVAIGSPLSLPRGLHCLETTCSCRPRSSEKGREAEQQLAEIGISIFPTIKTSVVKPLIYRGIGLRSKLREGGREVIEVYPYATAVLLLGDNVPKTKSPEKVEFLVNALGQRIEGLLTFSGSVGLFDERMCNAVLSALTALLHANGQTEELGDPGEGLIIVPKINKLVQVF